jgi:TolB-like protein/Flp pilus assembly protein TadD
MEYCEGKTATLLAQEEIIETERFLNIAQQIAQGLDAAHRQGVIHRDIKGANIIIERGDRVKILDFGLAKVLRANTTSSSSSAGFFGTVPYLSPEQARGGVADVRSDLFSAGVALYELASGKLPFNAEGPLALLEKIRDAEPEPFSPRDVAFPDSLARLIGKLLQKEPADRYQTAAELLEDLHTAAAEIEAHPTRPATTRRTAALGRTRRRRTIRYVAAAAGLVAVAIGIVITAEMMSRDEGHLGGRPLTPIRSIAVLPFQNLSEQQRDNFLSVGLADALVTRLQQIPSLQVRPTAAVLKFRGKEVDAQTAAEQLGVDGILHGRFLTSGGQVRVNLQLTDSRTGYGVWAGTIDGNRDNLITLMDDVSSRTANALQPATPGSTTHRSEPRTSSPEAFEHFLRARSFSGSLVPQQHADQIAALKRAIDLDPRFAAAHAELAIALSLGQIRGMEQDSVIAEAERYARQAVNLDPYLPEAHLALGRTLVRFPERFRESARENLSALRLNPNDPQALYTMASYLVASGDLGRRNCILERMVSLDPSSNDARTRGYFDVNSIDPDGTIESARFALVAPETALAGHDMLALAHLARDDFEAATREYQRAAEMAPNHYIPKSLAAMIAAGKGDRKEAERWISQFRGDAERNHWAALRIVQAYARLGDRQKAIQWARTTQQLGNHSWYFLVRHPWLQSLQNEPEYQAMLKEIRADLDSVHGDVLGVYDIICGVRSGS